jgi:predicted ester cyclase
VKGLTRLIEEANEALIGKGNIDAVGEYFDSGYAVHITGRVLNGGHKIVRDAVGELRKSFPDIRVEVEILVEGHDRVAWQRSLRGTHTGKFKGFPASNCVLEWRDMVTSRFFKGRIVEEWVVTDLAEQLLLSRKRGA